MAEVGVARDKLSIDAAAVEVKAYQAGLDEARLNLDAMSAGLDAATKTRKPEPPNEGK